MDPTRQFFPSTGQKLDNWPLQFFPPSGRKVDSWPEVVGWKGEEAKLIIKRDMPTASVQLVPEGFDIMMNYSRQRVRLFLDSEERVRSVPKVG